MEMQEMAATSFFRVCESKAENMEGFKPIFATEERRRPKANTVHLAKR
jgi:hypothetical protein